MDTSSVDMVVPSWSKDVASWVVADAAASSQNEDVVLVVEAICMIVAAVIPRMLLMDSRVVDVPLSREMPITA